MAMVECRFPFVRLDQPVFEEWKRDFPEGIKANLFLLVHRRAGRDAWVLSLIELSTWERIGCDSDDLHPDDRKKLYAIFKAPEPPRYSS